MGISLVRLIVLLFRLVCIYKTSSFFIKRNTKNHLNKNGYIWGEKTYVLQTEGIKEITNISDSTMKWKAFQKVVENDDYFFILVDKVAGFIIPKRYFDSIGDQERFKEILLKNILDHSSTMV